MIEEALETVELMLGSNKSRGYCLEMIRVRRRSAAHPQSLRVSILGTYRSSFCNFTLVETDV